MRVMTLVLGLIGGLAAVPAGVWSLFPVLAPHARMFVRRFGAVMIMDSCSLGNAGRVDDAEPFHGKAFAAWGWVQWRRSSCTYSYRIRER